MGIESRVTPPEPEHLSVNTVSQAFVNTRGAVVRSGIRTVLGLGALIGEGYLTIYENPFWIATVPMTAIAAGKEAITFGKGLASLLKSPAPSNNT